MQQLEKSLEPLADFALLAKGGEKLLDTITAHVVTRGFSAKVRELRSEFFSKHDFQLAAEKFVKPAELDKLKKDMEQRLHAQKRSISDLSNVDRDATGSYEGLKALIDECCTREQLEEL